MKKKMPTLHLQLSNKDTVAKYEYTINVNSAESVNLAIAVSALGQRFKFASARKLVSTLSTSLWHWPDFNSTLSLPVFGVR